MSKPWLQSYPPGVPAEVDVDEFASLKDILEHTCRTYPSRPAFSNLGTTICYAELDRLSRAFGAYLQKVLRLPRGDRVAIMLPNLIQYPVALFGVLRAGYAAVNTNPLYTARELEHQLRDSGATAIVVLENFAHTVEEVLPRTAVKQVITTRIGDLLSFPKSVITNLVVKYVKHMVPAWKIDGAIGLPQAIDQGGRHALDDVPVQAADVAFLQYTGGTTGVPKGAILTHGNLVANLQQTHAWVGGSLKPGKETVVTPLPLYHVFSLTANLLVFLKLGGHNVLITNPRDLPAFIKELQHTPFTAITGVNTLFNAMLNAPGIDAVDTSKLKLAVGGGMAVQRAVADKWKAVFRVPIVEGYGLTECSPIACANRLDIQSFTGTVGLPLPSTEVSIRDDAGAELPLGDVGEICVRGPQVMKGYWNRPDETAKVLTAEGWLRTGDMGFMDANGYVKIVDRKKDMILVSGFKVFPNEVEDVVAMHPDVLEVAAIPLADEKSGHVVKLVVVPRNAQLTEQALIEHCKKNLTGYKVPRAVVFRNEPLPKTNVGKILRRVIIEQEEAAAKGERVSA
jgi:long-chain acyl-CoA synthetase